ncbi:MAG: rRNA maturation RNase YbeY [Succinivibrio sp.]|nr:rRNA maturation RNase YbeY [Succinivibrio sp.]
MQARIDLQIALKDPKGVPELPALERWAQKALEIGGRQEDAELTVRIVSSHEIRELNRDYRKVDRPTNILSFPFECPPEVKLPLIGDLVICLEVTAREAKEQHKTLEEHFAHLIVHGCLHLLGYDHIKPEDAQIMEPLEIKAVEALGYDNPYKDDEA